LVIGGISAVFLGFKNGMRSDMVNRFHAILLVAIGLISPITILDENYYKNVG
jgi:hypothetical protein